MINKERFILRTNGRLEKRLSGSNVMSWPSIEYCIQHRKSLRDALHKSRMEYKRPELFGEIYNAE